MSVYSYCMFMYLHRASWHSSGTLTEVFPWSFLGCKANSTVKPAKMGTTSTLPKCLCRSVYCVFVCKCVLCYCHRGATQLQLTNVLNIGSRWCRWLFSRHGRLTSGKESRHPLTITLITWRIWWALINASKGQMGFNSTFRWLNWRLHRSYSLSGHFGEQKVLLLSWFNLRMTQIFGLSLYRPTWCGSLFLTLMCSPKWVVF